MWSKINEFMHSILLRETLRREEGQTLAEYALILALISIAAIAVMTPLGDAIAAKFTEVTTALG